MKVFAICTVSAGLVLCGCGSSGPTLIPQSQTVYRPAVPRSQDPYSLENLKPKTTENTEPDPGYKRYLSDPEKEEERRIPNPGLGSERPLGVQPGLGSSPTPMGSNPYPSYQSPYSSPPNPYGATGGGTQPYGG